MENGSYDLGISPAAAEISRHEFADFCGCGVGFSVQQAFRGHDLAGCTKSALQAIFLDKGLLDRMELAVLFQGFNGCDGLAVIIYGKGHTGVKGLVFDQDGAGPASAFVAPSFRSGQAQVFSQSIEKRSAGFHK